MKKFNTLDAGALVVWLLPAAYLLYVYPALPASVPVHFGLNGNPDRYGAKSGFSGIIYILMGVSAFAYLLLKFIPAIDPKKTAKAGVGTFHKIALAVVLFLAALSTAIIHSTIHHSFKIDKLVLPLAGLLFAFLGNLMYNIKPNYFAGVRTPWTLESEDTWRATHHLAGRLWFGGGIFVTIAVLVLPVQVGLIVFISMIVLLALIPVIYSYTYYKKHQLK